ncbi:MAG: hypothetical protein WC683_07070 [bacterium]
MGRARKSVKQMTPEEKREYWRERRRLSRAGLCSGSWDARRNPEFREWCLKHNLEPNRTAWNRFQYERGKR